LLLKLENIERKRNYLEENVYFRTTVITYVRSAIKCLRLLLVYITHHCYPRNGVQERVKYFRKYSTENSSNVKNQIALKRNCFCYEE